MLVDLHMHSCLSPCGDDDMTPANICGMAHIKGLTAEDLLSVARQLFAPERITTLIYK